MWVAYGVIIGASPVVVANLLVFSAAAWTATRKTPDGLSRPERAGIT
jgi:hypothetical protein